MRTFFLSLGLTFSIHASATSIEQAVAEIQFCHEVSTAAEAERKARLAETLIDPSKCWTANKWSLEEHTSLLAAGYILELFIPSRYVGDPRKLQRLEIFVWYADPKGKKRNYWNSCELSDEAKQFIAAHPQWSC